MYLASNGVKFLTNFVKWSGVSKVEKERLALVAA
jgi:hypothetical protein